MFAKRQHWWLLTLLIALLLAVGAACEDDGGGGEATPAPDETEDASSRTVEPSEIVSREDVLRKDPDITKTGELEWGWMFELSGGPPEIQVFGEVTGDGVKFAVEEINNDCTPRGICGVQIGDTIYTIKLLEHDTRSDVSNTRAIATQLVRGDGVNVIWGPATLGEAETTLITQPNQVLHLCACQDRERTALATEEKAHGESQWAFQTLPAVSRFFAQGARSTKEQFPQFDKVAIICIDTEVGRSVCGFYEEAYESAGFEIVARENFPPGVPDYSPFLTRIKSKNPDILLNYDSPTNQITLLRQALELDVAKALNTSLTPDLLEPLLGPDVRDKIFLSGGIPRQAAQPTSPEAAEYFEKYKEYKGGELPAASFVSLLSYDFVYMVVAAMQQANTVEDTTAIAKALEQLHYAGAAEDNIYFDDRHIAVMGSDDCDVVQGEFDCVHNPPPPPE